MATAASNLELATTLNPAQADALKGLIAQQSDDIKSGKLPKDYWNKLSRVLKAELGESYFYLPANKIARKLKRNYTFPVSDAVAALLGAIYADQHVPEQNIKSAFFSGDKGLAEAADGLNENGYVYMPKRLTAAKIKNVLSDIGDYNYRNRLTGETKKGAELTAAEEGSGVWWCDDLKPLTAKKSIQEIALDQGLLSVIQTHLGCPPILVGATVWNSFPDKNTDTSTRRNAQQFHRDQDYLKFCKVFVYLSDVDEGNGPHVYIAQSHGARSDALEGKDKDSTRRTDDTIVSHYGEENVVRITGPAGTVAVVSTRGFHKGDPVVTKKRMLCQFTYAGSLYFGPGYTMDKAGLKLSHFPSKAEIPARVLKNFQTSDRLQSKPTMMDNIQYLFAMIRGRM